MTTPSGPCRSFVRAAIFGVLAVFVVIFVLVAVVIGLIRLLNNEVFDQAGLGELPLGRRNLRGRRDVYLEDAPQPELAGRHEGESDTNGVRRDA